MKKNVKLGSLTIAADATDSSAYAIGKNISRLSVLAPSALTGAVTVHVSNDGGTTYYALYVGGSDVTITAQKTQWFEIVGFTHLKLISDASEGALRTFKLSGTEER